MPTNDYLFRAVFTKDGDAHVEFRMSKEEFMASVAWPRYIGMRTYEALQKLREDELAKVKDVQAPV